MCIDELPLPVLVPTPQGNTPLDVPIDRLKVGEFSSTNIAEIILHNVEVILNCVFRVLIEALILMTPGALDCNLQSIPL